MSDANKVINISNNQKFKKLFLNIKNGELFARKFKFSNKDFLIRIFEYLKVDNEKFNSTNFYYDKSRSIHISESESGYVWISTIGLVTDRKSSKNKFVNSFLIQDTVIQLLIEKSIEVCAKENIYDIDSYYYDELSKLSPALFHNFIFYVETLCKAYLSLNEVKFKPTHKLSYLFKKSKELMFKKKQNDSIFHALILDEFEKLINHIKELGKGFKEQFVKYDDNPSDDSVIVFEFERLISLKNTLDISLDFLSDFEFFGSESHYVKQGFYQKVITKAKNSNHQKQLEIKYQHLIK